MSKISDTTDGKQDDSPRPRLIQRDRLAGDLIQNHGLDARQAALLRAIAEDADSRTLVAFSSARRLARRSGLGKSRVIEVAAELVAADVLTVWSLKTRAKLHYRMLPDGQHPTTYHPGGNGGKAAMPNCPPSGDSDTNATVPETDSICPPNEAICPRSGDVSPYPLDDPHYQSSSSVGITTEAQPGDDDEWWTTVARFCEERGITTETHPAFVAEARDRMRNPTPRALANLWRGWQEPKAAPPGRGSGESTRERSERLIARAVARQSAKVGNQ